jgi:hypothetical protein
MALDLWDILYTFVFLLPTTSYDVGETHSLVPDIAHEAQIDINVLNGLSYEKFVK